MWGNAKRNDGIISLTRNNDGLSRWRDKSAQSLFHLLSLEGVGLVSAEDEDLTVMEDELRSLSPALPWREEEKPQQIQKSVLFRPCMCVSTRSGLKGRSVLPTEREKVRDRSA